MKFYLVSPIDFLICQKHWLLMLNIDSIRLAILPLNRGLVLGSLQQPSSFYLLNYNVGLKLTLIAESIIRNNTKYVDLKNPN